MNRQRVAQQETQQKNWHHTLYATHEAGHAVVGYVIGRCIAEVSIVADKARGYCVFSAFVEDPQG